MDSSGGFNSKSRMKIRRMRRRRRRDRRRRRMRRRGQVGQLSYLMVQFHAAHTIKS